MRQQKLKEMPLQRKRHWNAKRHELKNDNIEKNDNKTINDIKHRESRKFGKCFQCENNKKFENTTSWKMTIES